VFQSPFQRENEFWLESFPFRPPIFDSFDVSINDLRALPASVILFLLLTISPTLVFCFFVLSRDNGPRNGFRRPFPYGSSPEIEKPFPFRIFPPSPRMVLRTVLSAVGPVWSYHRDSKIAVVFCPFLGHVMFLGFCSALPWPRFF